MTDPCEQAEQLARDMTNGDVITIDERREWARKVRRLPVRVREWLANQVRRARA